MDRIIISQFELLHDFDLFEDTFLPAYSADDTANPANNNVRNMVGNDDHHSDHVAPYIAETMVEEMIIVDEEMPHLAEHEEEEEEEAVNANRAVTQPTNCDSCNAETQADSPLIDIDVVDWSCLFEVVNSGTVSQEGEAAETEQLLAPFSDKNNFDYLEKILNGETTQEIIHGTNCKTEPMLKRSCGGDNNVKKWVTRKRYKKGSAEDAQRKEEYKIKNRVAAARSFERKQVKHI